MDSTATYDRDVLEKNLNDPTSPPIYLPIQFLKDITNNFSREQELGKGGYGIVYKGVLQSGKVIAVKKIFDMHLLEDDQFQREVSYLMGIKHKNIVQLVGYCAETRWVAIELPNGYHGMAELPIRLLCFEYLCKKSLDKYISDESSGLDWSKRFEIIKGICSGLHFLHEKHIVHLDLKPQNILMDASMMPKVADFGLSRLLGAEKSRTIINGNLLGSRGYMAPEYFFQGVISQKADMFSFGVIIIELITGCRNYPLINTDPHFQHESYSCQSNEIDLQEYIDMVLGRWRNIFQKQLNNTLSDIYTQQVKECISIALKCVVYNLARRPNSCDILQMLCAVESTNCHAKDINDSLIYQVRDADIQAGPTWSPHNMERLPHTLPSKPLMWKLAFKIPPQLPIITGSNIKGASGGPLEIILVDMGTGSPAPLPQVLLLELVPLIGDFPADGREDWAADEFQKGILKEREGKCPLLMGDVSLTMRDGHATVGELQFTDNSSLVSCFTFRIGARVVPGSLDGTRVQEAVTEAFVVTDRNRGQWRLDNIGKGVASNKNLEQQDVKTVQEFVMMLTVKPEELRTILKDYMTECTEEATTMELTKCHTDDSKNVIVYQEQHQLQRARLLQSARCIMEMLSAKHAAWKLAFQTQPLLPIFTGSQIQDSSGSPLEIVLLHAATGSPAILPLLRLKLVPLSGDFPQDGREDWAADEFSYNILRERNGTAPLLTGDVHVTMLDGRATVDELRFTDNSSWLRCRKFRIGVRVVPGSFYGARVHEAITEAFIVRDHRGELYRKHYPPILGDEVWRLEKIGKEGGFNKRLQENSIFTVQDFLRMLMVKPNELRTVLGVGMTDRMWEATTNHAKTCVIPNDRVYAYITPHGTVYVDPVFQIVKAELGGEECPLDQLTMAQEDYLRNLILEAYKNRHSLLEVDASMIPSNAGDVPLRHAPATLLRERPVWKLAFQTPLQLPIFACRTIEGATGGPLEIILVDVAGTGSSAALQQLLEVDLVPLIGDFPPEGRDDWTADEFRDNIVMHREGKPPLLTGEVRVTMRAGRAAVGELQFTDNSSWVRCRKFRIGARVALGSFDGARVLEAITEAFVVRDYPNHSPRTRCRAGGGPSTS